MLADADTVLAKIKCRHFHDSRECAPVYFGQGKALFEDSTADFVMPEAVAKRLQMKGVGTPAAA